MSLGGLSESPGRMDSLGREVRSSKLWSGLDLQVAFRFAIPLVY
jgi:hypothetical protein